MRNGIFQIDWASVGDAVLMAVITAVVVGLVQLVGTTGFDLFTANWVSIGHNVINTAFIAGVVTLGQQFLSTNRGSILGIGAENVPASK